MTGEFDLIAECFRPLAGPEGLGLRDDAACLSLSSGDDLIVTKDMLVEGIHFFGDEPAASIAKKCLAANLSDLAAKGAVPSHYFLAISLPKEKTRSWVQDFAKGLEQMQRQYGISLSGGDTTGSNGPAVISITAMGMLPAGTMLRRDGAMVGDDIYVSGSLGDAALGLKVLEAGEGELNALTDRYFHPTPRVALGQALRGVASACADISDGLLADLGHIAKASGLAAQVHEAQLPLSEEALRYLSENSQQASLIYSGGDDYELVFTAPASARKEMAGLSKQYAVSITKIGEMSKGQGVQLVDPDGKLVQADATGFDHFSGKE